MRTRSSSAVLSAAMILALVGCGSDDAGEGDGGADTTVESSTDGGQSGGTGGSDGAEPSISLDAPPSDGKAEITIDGQKLDGDLMVMCSSTSQLGAPNPVFITGNQGQPTVGGTKIDGPITISIGYGPESGGKMPIADGSANIPGIVQIITAPEGTPLAEGQQLSGESDGETWTFSVTAKNVTPPRDPHTVEGTVTCTP